jgi:hypothetical protein
MAVQIKDSKYYRKKIALAEGRLPGVVGRPPLLQEEHLEILYSRIRQKILEKIQVSKVVLAEMV